MRAELRRECLGSFVCLGGENAAREMRGEEVRVELKFVVHIYILSICSTGIYYVLLGLDLVTFCFAAAVTKAGDGINIFFPPPPLLASLLGGVYLSFGAYGGGGKPGRFKGRFPHGSVPSRYSVVRP